ncbi:MAG: DUF808 domain-containing protein [Myxococcales bacterium]|nr:DUF808 domain-containing protein [Myxococcales bacterium]
MPGASLLTLLDDIATILDDVATMTKVAAKQTAGVLGDDLALNAQQVAGVRAHRELPVVWRVAKGSVRNKLILVPLALAISALAPFLVTPLLMLGGAFLCFEGVEKLVHKWLEPHKAHEDHAQALVAASADSESALLALETDKIAGAIRTDFILSAEIVIIALGTVSSAPLGTRISVLFVVAALMTVGVYGLVAGIVKMDDAGAYLMRPRAGKPASGVAAWTGAALVHAAPWLMKGLAVAGTIAMFLVGGGILSHGIAPLHHAFETWSASARHVSTVGAVLSPLLALLLDALLGVVTGAILVTVVVGARRFVRPKAP